MSDGLLGSFGVALFADTREFGMKMDEAMAKVGIFQKEIKKSGSALAAAGSKAATGWLYGVGGALAYGIDLAYKYTEAIDQIGIQSGASAQEVTRLRSEVLVQSATYAKSTTEIADAYLLVEKAGIRRAAADRMVANASMAAWVTDSTASSVVKDLIAIRALKSAQGMSDYKITSLLVAAEKNHIGTLDSLSQVVTGKVGAALSLYGMGLKESLVLSNAFSSAGYNNVRSINSFAASMGKLLDPTKTMDKHFRAVGLSAQDLAHKARQPDGLIAVLETLRRESAATNIPLSVLLQTVFGTGGAAAASVLVKNLDTIKTQLHGLGDSGKTFATSWAEVQKTPKFQLSKLEANLKDALTQAGLWLLPGVTHVVEWVNSVVATIKHNKGLQEALKIGFDIATGLAIASKLKKAMGFVQSIFGTAPLAANTVATEENTAALLRAAGASLVGGAEAAGGASFASKLLKGLSLAQLASLAGEIGTGAVAGLGAAALIVGPMEILKLMGGKPQITRGDSSFGAQYRAAKHGYSISEEQWNHIVFAVDHNQANAVAAYMDAHGFNARKAATGGRGWQEFDRLLGDFAKLDAKGIYTTKISAAQKVEVTVHNKVRVGR